MDEYGFDDKVVFRPRCWYCNKLLAELLTPPWRVVCPRCKSINPES
jgi:phage FluMu protein Com